jgi:hypothetical protein
MMRLIKRALLASAVGLVLSVWIIQNTPSVQERVSTTMIQAIEKAWNARVLLRHTKSTFSPFPFILPRALFVQPMPKNMLGALSSAKCTFRHGNFCGIVALHCI